MNLVRGIFGAFFGAALGAGIWIAVGYLVGYQSAWLAVFVGLGAGIGMCSASGAKAKDTGGIIAAALCLVAIVGAKFALLNIAASDAIQRAEATTDRELPPIENRHFWIEVLTEDRLRQMVPDNQLGDWLSDPQLYNQLVDQSRALWDSWTVDQRRSYREDVTTWGSDRLTSRLQTFRADVPRRHLQNSFGLLDVLFAALAATFAFRLGAITVKPRSTIQTVSPR